MHIRHPSWARLGRVLIFGLSLFLLLAAPALADDNQDNQNQDSQGQDKDKKPKKNAEQRADPQAGDDAPLTPIGDTLGDTFEGSATHWVFVDESKPGAPAPDGAPVQIGAKAPSGEMAVRFTLNSTMQALAIHNQDDRLHGLRLADLNRLTYCTYLVDAPMPYAVMLQLNMDLDVTDADRDWQGRLVYEPARNGGVVQGEWQCWDTLNGVWWATSGPLAALATPDSPQPLAVLLDEAPNLGLHPTYGALVLKAGGGWPRFDGYADGLILGFDEHLAMFDFEGPDANQEGRDGANDRQGRDNADTLRLANFDDKDDCKKNGWQAIGFRNQGQCVAYFNYLANHPDHAQAQGRERD